MNRLYSINSENGRGYGYLNNSLELEKKTEDYYQFYIKESDEESDEENLYSEYIFETQPGICSHCKKNLTFNNENIYNNYKLLYPNESLFTFVNKRGDEYWYIYYHFCNVCFNKALYNWSYKNERKYPRLRIDGSKFINSLNNMDLNNIPNNINFPKIYRCDYYLSEGYRYLENNKKYNNEDNIKYKKLIDMELKDIKLRCHI